MKRISKYLHKGKALVIDGNEITRSILVSQLYELGLNSVSQASRIAEGRRYLENQTFDVVVCEQSFANDAGTGQDLLDDLRRSGLLPFGTIFIMITAEASYSKVAEAAESALDAYLLKPHTAARLLDRITQARKLKAELQDIFVAIERQDFETAARLCQARYADKADYWLYATRIGAELLMRLDRFDEAQKLYETVIQHKTLPWARLGVARAQIENDQPQKAVATLASLIDAEPGYADAYDVMGRAQIELGQFDAALQAYRMATQLTPSSIGRLQRHGMLAYYRADPKTAEDLLVRSVRLGLDSKIFDPQTLVVLALMRFDNNDPKGLQQCLDNMSRLVGKEPDNPRLQRLKETIRILGLLLNEHFETARQSVQDMAASIPDPDFDFEAACNFLSLLSLLARHELWIDQAESTLHTLGLRFATSRSVGELLSNAAAAHTGYADLLHRCYPEVLHMIEQAFALNLKGKPKAAVERLCAQGETTRNAKIIESAWLVLKQYRHAIPEAHAMEDMVQALRTRYQTQSNRPIIGDRNPRQAGSLSLRGMDNRQGSA